MSECINVWQLLIDLTTRCEECGGTLKVQSPIIADEATVRCSECDTWYRCKVENGQVRHSFLRRLRQ